MKGKLADFSLRYQAALQAHLKQGSRTSLESARKLSREAFAVGLQTLDFAKLHEQTVLAELSPTFPVGKRTVFFARAGAFLAAAIIPDDRSPVGKSETVARLEQLTRDLSQRTVELAASNRELSLEVAHRKTVEQALKKKERHYAQVLRQSEQLQEQLRRLSRQILSAQEAERKEISRELHDIVAQSLTGINLRLAALKKEAAINTKGLEQNIARTQRLVEDSVNIVHRFARELRPAVLDVLGLIPALHSFMKNFTERTGVRTRLTAFAEVEQLHMTRRTVLFRVVQEALTNVGRHAQASRVDVSIERRPGGVHMTVGDDGKSFQVQRVLLARGSKRLGLLGMRERLEMVGGRFEVDSTPGQGTTITAQVPFRASTGRKTKPTTAPAAATQP